MDFDLIQAVAASDLLPLEDEEELECQNTDVKQQLQPEKKEKQAARDLTSSGSRGQEKASGSLVAAAQSSFTTLNRTSINPDTYWTVHSTLIGPEAEAICGLQWEGGSEWDVVWCLALAKQLCTPEKQYVAVLRPLHRLRISDMYTLHDAIVGASQRCSKLLSTSHSIVWSEAQNTQVCQFPPPDRQVKELRFHGVPQGGLQPAPQPSAVVAPPTTTPTTATFRSQAAHGGSSSATSSFANLLAPCLHLRFLPMTVSNLTILNGRLEGGVPDVLLPSICARALLPHQELQTLIRFSLSYLRGLRTIVISGHSLKGSIGFEFVPRSIESLDLSSNLLSGPVDWEPLRELRHLGELNLSNNQLEGEIDFSPILLRRQEDHITFKLRCNRFDSVSLNTKALGLETRRRFGSRSGSVDLSGNRLTGVDRSWFNIQTVIL